MAYFECIYNGSGSDEGSAEDLGMVSTYDASSIQGYQDLTVDNFIVEIISAPATNSVTETYEDKNWYGSASGFTINKSYNSSTGLFTLSGVSQSISLKGGSNFARTQSLNYKVWLVQ